MECEFTDDYLKKYKDELIKVGCTEFKMIPHPKRLIQTKDGLREIDVSKLKGTKNNKKYY